MVGFISNSPEETKRLGVTWGRCLPPGAVVALIGELGAGKTCLVKGLLEGLGVQNKYSGRSSTFILLNEYQGRVPVYHFDIYRLGDLREIIDLGYQEYLYGSGVSIIEWAEKMVALLPPQAIKIELIITGVNRRCLKVAAVNEHIFKQ